MNINKIKSCLYGSAFGDSLGGLTEFFDAQHILERWPSNGPEELQENPAAVTDDTRWPLCNVFFSIRKK